MFRVFLLIFLNLSLPFLLYGLRHWLWRFYLKRRGKPYPPSAVPPLHMAVVIKLLFVGVVLLAGWLFWHRLYDAPPPPPKLRLDGEIAL